MRVFDRKVDAQRWLDEQTAALVTGQFVQPGAGRVTFRAYAEQWRAIQSHRLTTREHVESRLRIHAYPAFGDRPLSTILPTEIQGWVASLEGRLAPASIGVLHGIVHGVFAAAVRDRKIAANPCADTRLPKVSDDPVLPLTVEQVHSLIEASGDIAPVIRFAAGTGCRQGEVFGLTVDRVRFLERTIRIDRQLQTTRGAGFQLVPPKTKASVRSIPLPSMVVDTLAEQVRGLRPVTVGGEPVNLVFRNSNGEPWRRSTFGDRWRHIVRNAGLPEGTVFHDLRHFYASVLIEHGESVKTVQARLGHKSAVETLDVYGHLWPTADETTRAAIDDVFGVA